jgi:hypothetical protein
MLFVVVVVVVVVVQTKEVNNVLSSLQTVAFSDKLVSEVMHARATRCWYRSSHWLVDKRSKGKLNIHKLTWMTSKRQADNPLGLN